MIWPDQAQDRLDRRVSLLEHWCQSEEFLCAFAMSFAAGSLAVSELMALYRFTVIGLHWQAAPPPKKRRFYNGLS